MSHRLASAWARVVDGFWLVPGAAALAYALAGVIVVAIDRRAGPRGLDLAFQGDADAARDVLTTIAGSLITVAGLAFSLTIVVLSLISSQFSPRAVRSLLADKVTQVVAGSFVGIFAYCLVVLRTVRAESPEASEFVPSLAVALAIVLALLALALLLVFIHHAGTSIQVSHIAARIAHETLSALDRLYPEPYGRSLAEPVDELLEGWNGSAPAVVAPRRVGYVQAIDLDEIVAALAGAAGVTRLHVPVRPGDFVTNSTSLVEAWPAAELPEHVVETVRKAFVVDDERDLRQDADYGLRQLADVALRALSPGVNDPTTAANCIAHLAAALEKLSERDIPGPVRRDGGVVMLAARREFDEYLETAFGEVARYAIDNARVVAELLRALARVAAAARRAGALDRVEPVHALALAVAGPALERASSSKDRSIVRAALGAVELPFPAAP